MKSILLFLSVLAFSANAQNKSNEILKTTFCNQIDRWFDYGKGEFDKQIREELKAIYRFDTRKCYQGTHSFKTLKTTKVGSKDFPSELTSIYREKKYYCYAKTKIKYDVKLDSKNQPIIRPIADHVVQICNFYYAKELSSARTDHSNVKKMSDADRKKYSYLFSSDDVNTGFTDMADFNVRSLDQFVVFHPKKVGLVIGRIERTVIASSEGGGPYFEYLYYNEKGQYIYSLRKDNLGW